jgi:hypothetical protein
MTSRSIDGKDASGAVEIKSSINNRWTLLASILIYLIIGLVLFGSTGRDDVNITYWVVESLSTIGEMTNYNNNAVEQSSSLLHFPYLRN